MSILAWIEDQKRLKLLNAPKYVNPASDSSKGLWTRCDKCGVILYIKHLKENQRVCFGCSYHLQMSSQERVENLLDKESWRPLDETVSPCDPLEFHDQKDYTDRLQEAQERTGLQDAIQTGSGMVDGIPIALGVMDFEFMGGSMGSVVGEKVTRLIEYATQEGLTLVLVCASGGARMQEGVFSLMQMAKISSALQVYQACANLLYISILTSPTTGGVTASFAMLGDIIFAEPKALVAFAGRRVIEQTLCEDLPEDFQTSEYMLHHGLLDLIVPRRFFRQALSESIRLYKNAPFKKPGRIPFGVQNPITFLIEERIRRRWAVGNASVADRLSRLSEESAPQFAENTLFSASAQDASTQDASAQDTSAQETSAQDASTQDESLQNQDAVISSPELLNNRVANTFDNIRRSSKSITEGVSSSPYPLLKREAPDYRDILTSFQTMFHLFSKELVVPYTSSNTFDENNTNLDATQPKQKQTVVNTFTRRIKRTNLEQKQDAYGTNPENWDVDSPELSSVVHASFGTAPDLDKAATSMDLLLQRFITLSENQNINQVKTKVEEDVSPDNASNGINRSKLAKTETGKISQTQSSAQARQIHLSSDETNFPNTSSDSVSTSDYSALSSQNRPEETVADLSDSRSIYVDFFNQSIELAATESVEWRAFYLHQSISQRTGFLEDLAQSLPDYQKNSHDIAFQNMLFYRSICRKLS